MNYKPKQNKNTDLLKYASLGTQIFAGLGIAVFVGYKADQWLNISIPLIIWLLPLLVLSVMIYKLINETSKKKKEHEK